MTTGVSWRRMNQHALRDRPLKLQQTPSSARRTGPRAFLPPHMATTNIPVSSNRRPVPSPTRSTFHKHRFGLSRTCSRGPRLPSRSRSRITKSNPANRPLPSTGQHRGRKCMHRSLPRPKGPMAILVFLSPTSTVPRSNGCHNRRRHLILTIWGNKAPLAIPNRVTSKAFPSISRFTPSINSTRNISRCHTTSRWLNMHRSTHITRSTRHNMGSRRLSQPTLMADLCSGLFLRRFHNRTHMDNRQPHRNSISNYPMGAHLMDLGLLGCRPTTCSSAGLILPRQT